MIINVLLKCLLDKLEDCKVRALGHNNAKNKLFIKLMLIKYEESY